MVQLLEKVGALNHGIFRRGGGGDPWADCRDSMSAWVAVLFWSLPENETSANDCASISCSPGDVCVCWGSAAVTSLVWLSLLEFMMSVSL